MSVRPDRFVMITTDDIRRKLRSGEDSATEFRERPGDLEQLAAEIVGLANAGGGHILVGVTDEGRVAGLNDPATVVRKLSAICREAVRPALLPLVELYVIEQEPIAALEVRPTRPPYRTAKGRLFLRMGLAAEEVPLQTWLDLTQAASEFNYDATAVPTAGLDELDRELLADYFWRTRINWLDGQVAEPEPLLGALIAQKDGEELRLTVAGLICFGRDPQRHLPEGRILARRFTGDEADSPLAESAEICGSLTRQIDRALEFVLRRTHVPPPSPVLRGDDTPKYPRGTLREFIVNAVVHRDYRRSAPVRIDIFDHRLEIASPGGLPRPLTMAGLRWRNRLPRNPLIVQYLSRLGYVKEHDSGLAHAVQLMAGYNRQEPEFEDRGEEFVVTLRWKETG